MRDKPDTPFHGVPSCTYNPVQAALLNIQLLVTKIPYCYFKHPPNATLLENQFFTLLNPCALSFKMTARSGNIDHEFEVAAQTNEWYVFKFQSNELVR